MALKEEDIAITELFKDKVKVLKRIFFLSPPQADLFNIDDIIYLGPIRIDNKLIKKKVRVAIFRSKQDKTLEINGILNRFLRIIARELLPQLTRLF